MSISGSSEPEKKSARRKVGRPLDAAKRAAIVEAAAHHFFHHGYAATAIEQVAADAGVSKVTIYNQFGDKRALFTAAVECECEKMRGHFSLDGGHRARSATGFSPSARLSLPSCSDRK